MGFSDFFRKKASSNIAKDRLKLVLVSDRANCSPDVMEQIKNDIINVISESEGNNGTVPALFANIPIKDMKPSSVK